MHHGKKSLWELYVVSSHNPYHMSACYRAGRSEVRQAEVEFFQWSRKYSVLITHFKNTLLKVKVLH